MKYMQNNKEHYLVATIFISVLMLSSSVFAANVKLATAPLADATTTSVLPNLMFVLDNSGSMDLEYIPDSSSSTVGRFFKNAGYNGIYYNPAIVYTPPVYSTGASFDSKNTEVEWQSVPYDSFGKQSGVCPNGSVLANCNLVKNADYYTYIPGEYCADQSLRDCTVSTTPVTGYTMGAGLRYCKDAATAASASPALGACQAVYMPGFTSLRVPGAGAKATFTYVSGTVTSIKVRGLEILNGAANTATNIRNSINVCTPETSTPAGNCTIRGFSATLSGSSITITSPYGAGDLPVVSGGIVTSITAFTGGMPGKIRYVKIDKDISTAYPYPDLSVKADTRIDCKSTTCSYDEEMTNFANWFTYYHTRMQAMKSSSSLAFNAVDSAYRVGFMTINNTASNYLSIADFTASQKKSWYDKLFAAVPDGATPLRAALSTVGRIYAGKKPIVTKPADTDPIQYSCQQNFTLLTTDGYWNEVESGVRDINGNIGVGNLDSDKGTEPIYEGKIATSNTLADVAKYYYDTDLRTPDNSTCLGALGAGIDICANNVFTSSTDDNKRQHMTTFTMGLGVNGTLLYSSDYLTANSGDYVDIKNGLKSWSVPSNNDPTAVDDLWHAAVNGRGQYFSAKDPVQMVTSLKAALAAISSKIGSGSAAATSSLQPTAGDNFAYIASYTTSKWTGNLEARTVNVSTGEVSKAATWCAEDVISSTCAKPGTIEADSATGVYYCVVPGSDATSCKALEGTLEATSCKVKVATSCSGQMKKTAFSDRKIYTKGTTGLVEFKYGNLSTANQVYFNEDFLKANLSQWSSYTDEQKANKPVGENFINYLKGDFTYEDRNGNSSAKRLFRYRQATLGDLVESQPAFIGKPTFSYTDTGYAKFKSDKATRAGMVYVGSNDGMLHAFLADSSTGAGTELWAYVPSTAIPKMWKLADKNYATMHTNYVNGDPIISDICDNPCSSASSWRTILVGGLNAGGRGYYAIDITNPNSPTLLWEYTAADDPNLGYSYGNPVITKLNNGTWVVLFTSGYNNGSIDSDGTTPNSPKGDGKGYLFVVNAKTGKNVISPISTGEGNIDTPSGLAQIAAYADQAEKNNLTTYVYGGDLLGNLWRFDINTGKKLKFATFGDKQPITVRPELGVIKNTRVVFVGTGKYLELSDLGDSTDIQTLYAISDKDETTTLTSPRAPTMREQKLTQTGTSRTSKDTVGVDIPNDRGWFINLPVGERQNVNAQLVLGTLIVPTTVPSSTVCAPGGTGFINYFDYRTGAGVAGSNSVVSTQMNSPIVGLNVLYINGKPVVSGVEANDPTPKLIPSVKFSNTSSGFNGTRVIWRELIQ